MERTTCHTCLSTTRMMLRMIKAKSYGLFHHSIYSAMLSNAVAMRLGFAEDEREDLVLAALLHDIGKQDIPDQILLKDGELTKVETSIVQQHPVWGAEIVSLTNLSRLAPLIEMHHEMPDGSGYPNGLTANGMPEIAKVIAVVDKFAALTTKRSYPRKKGLACILKDHFTPSEAIEVIAPTIEAFFNGAAGAVAECLNGIDVMEAFHLTQRAEKDYDVLMEEFNIG